MAHVSLLNDLVKKFGFESINYQNISVPNGWVVECKVFKKLNKSSYSSISYDSDITIATENSARLVFDQINRSASKNIEINVEFRVPHIDDPLPPRRQPKIINKAEYQAKKNLLDKELEEYFSSDEKQELHIKYLSEYIKYLGYSNI